VLAPVLQRPILAQTQQGHWSVEPNKGTKSFIGTKAQL
jgi:hypothetical protein